MATVLQSGGSFEFTAIIGNIDAVLGAVVFESFLYGIYTILFMICAYIILQRQHNIHWIFQVLVLAMYMLASTDIGYTMWLLFAKLLKGDAVPYMYLRVKYWFYVANVFFADSLLLYRCYIVWNRDKRVVIASAMLLIATLVCGCIFASSSQTGVFPQSWVYRLLTFVLNVTLTTLTASRIWWISRKARGGVHPELLHRYNITTMILIESGFIYSLYVVIDLAFNPHPSASGSVVLDTGLIQIVGIMPTLILAQVGLGRNVRDVEAIEFTAVHTRNYVNKMSLGTSQTHHKSKGPFSVESHHFQLYANNHHKDSLEEHRDEGNELDPVSGVGERTLLAM